MAKDIFTLHIRVDKHPLEFTEWISKQVFLKETDFLRHNALCNALCNAVTTNGTGWH